MTFISMCYHPSVYLLFKVATKMFEGNPEHTHPMSPALWAASQAKAALPRVGHTEHSSSGWCRDHSDICDQIDGLLSFYW